MNLKKSIQRYLRGYLIVTGIASHVVALFGILYVTYNLGYSPSELFYKVAGKIEDKSSNIVASVLPSVNVKTELDGIVRVQHPRILLPSLSAWNGEGAPELIKSRLSKYNDYDKRETDPCVFEGMLAMASCWVTTGNEKVANNLLSELLSYEIAEPTEEDYGNAWAYVLAYDLLRTYKGLNNSHIANIEKKIEVVLEQYLTILDGYSASLWHGRTTLSSIAWLCAVVLDANTEHKNKLILHAQSHFINVINAIELTEAWPEGYNYWIQSRAFIFVLAASGYVNGIEGGIYVSRLKKLLERIGYWHIYATRPDHRIEGFADEGSRIDLKDETRRIIDIIAQMTKNKNLAKYSLYLRKLHGRESYYYGYRWGFRLFNDPSLHMSDATIPDLSYLKSQLPTVELFGKNAMNLLYINSDWSPNRTFISYKAGHNFTHHGHYDAGHFTIYKGAPLAVNSSVYGEYTGENRLNYSIRTIAKNSLLILNPNEVVKPNRFFSKNITDGGQRITMPTGSGITSIQDWRNNIDDGKHYEGGRLLSYDHSENEYTYISSDLTSAYNNILYSEPGNDAKVKQVTRSLMYLSQYDKLIVFDHVVSTNSSYVKKWLLHTTNKPLVENEKILVGNKNNGIMESRDSIALIENKNSTLHIQKIYPTNALIRIVGGDDYQYYVETDGDEKKLNGINFMQGSVTKPWFDSSKWRLEIQPEFPHITDDFLVVLSPRIGRQKISSISKPLILTENAKAITLDQSKTIVFVYDHTGKSLKMLMSDNTKKMYIMGLPSNVTLEIKMGEYDLIAKSNSNGIAKILVDDKFDLKQAKINIAW
jgi:hypothetical protein